MQFRRSPDRYFTCLFAGLCLVAIASPSAASTDPRPNILLIVIDTLRAADLSHAGYKRPTSPQLDKLAKKSVVFQNTVSVGANTSVAMAGLMTGRLPYFEFDQPWTDEYLFGMNRFYTKDGEIGLPSSLDSLAERLRAEGYFTAGVVTNPYLQKTYQFDQGFTVYEELMAESGYVSGDKVTDAAIGILNSLAPRPPTLGPRGPGRYGTARPNPPRSPFFLYLHYMDVHGPYSPPERFSHCFAPKQPKNRSRLTPSAWRRWEKPEAATAEERQKMLPAMKEHYDCSIRFVDEEIGRVLSRLTELGLTNNTIVVVTSDHGEEFLEHGGTTHKGSVYQELLRVPLIFYVPGVSPRNVSGLVRNFDLTPTLLDLAGVRLEPTELDAVSLRPLIEGENETLKLPAYVNFPWVRMYLEGDHKLIERANGRLELYDLTADPKELNPEIKSDPSISSQRLKVRRDSILEKVQKSGVQRAKTNSPSKEVGTQHGPDEATRNQLRALGYLD